VDAWGLEGEKTGRGAYKLLAPSSFFGVSSGVFHFFP